MGREGEDKGDAEEVGPGAEERRAAVKASNVTPVQDGEERAQKESETGVAMACEANEVGCCL